MSDRPPRKTLPPRDRAGRPPWWLTPAGVVLLAAASVVFGAVGLPSLRRQVPGPDAPAEEVSRPVAWGPAVPRPATSPEPDGAPALNAVMDREFFLRVHRDVTGRSPSAEAARAFGADADPTKRAKLVDELLASPEHGRHLARLRADGMRAAARRVMKADRRERVPAMGLTGRDHPLSARAAATRYWTHFLGQGSLESAPLDVLAEAYRRSGYDVKVLFRAILNSDAYQRAKTSDS
ncbi:MAG: DUF1549 domain-containing protein [Gemmataceae bacterium]